MLLALFVWVVRLYLRGALTSTFVGCGGVALVSSYFLDLLPFNFVVPADILYLAVSRRGRARVWLTLRQDHELLSYLCTVGVIQAPPGLEERPFGWRAVLCAVWVMLSIGVSAFLVWAAEGDPVLGSRFFQPFVVWCATTWPLFLVDRARCFSRVSDCTGGWPAVNVLLPQEVFQTLHKHTHQVCVS